jgi:hypothetical protein
VVSAIRDKKKQEEQNRCLREIKQDIRGMLDRASAHTSSMLEKMAIGPVLNLTRQGFTLLQDKKDRILKYGEQNQEMSLLLDDKRNQCFDL